MIDTSARDRILAIHEAMTKVWTLVLNVDEFGFVPPESAIELDRARRCIDTAQSHLQSAAFPTIK